MAYEATASPNTSQVGSGVHAVRRAFLAVTAGVLFALGRAALVRTPASPSALATLEILVALALGVALADLLSGLVHWTCDTFFEEDTPLVGPILIRSFRNHHVEPEAIARGNLLDNNAASSFAAFPVALVGLLPGLSAAATWAAVACALTALSTNQFHVWAHSARIPAPVRWLQRLGIIISPERHAHHHTSGVTHYAVATGWTNPLLDAALAVARLPRGRR